MIAPPATAPSGLFGWTSRAQDEI